MKQIEKSKQRKIWLNCGGFITIDQTEALVAIDVNSGKFTGKSTLEETVYKVASIIKAKKCSVNRIEEVYLDTKEEEIHELLMEEDYINESLTNKI